jgi:hypothetical protein
MERKTQMGKTILAAYETTAWIESISSHIDQARNPQHSGITPREHIRGNLLMIVIADYCSQVINETTYGRLIQELNETMGSANLSGFTPEDIEAIRKMIGT